MRHIVTAVVAASLAAGAVAVVSQPALPAVRHIVINHSPASMPVFDVGSGTPPESTTVAPDAAKNNCGSCSTVGTNCTANCPHPAVMQIPVVQVPM